MEIVMLLEGERYMSWKGGVTESMNSKRQLGPFIEILKILKNNNFS